MMKSKIREEINEMVRVAKEKHENEDIYDVLMKSTKSTLRRLEDGSACDVNLTIGMKQILINQMLILEKVRYINEEGC